MELTKYYLPYIYPNCRVYILNTSNTRELPSLTYTHKLDKFKLKYPTHSFEASSHKEAIKITKLLT